MANARNYIKMMQFLRGYSPDTARSVYKFMSPTEGGGFLTGASNALKASFRKAPILSTLGAAQTGLFLSEAIGGPLLDSVNETFDLKGSFQADLEERVRQRRLLERLEQRQSRLQSLQQQNMALLAGRDPTLYASLMAGRPVPEGAMVIGGTPRMDLLGEVVNRGQ